MKTSCRYLEQYLDHLSIIKERSPCTIIEYRTDVTMFLNWYIAKQKEMSLHEEPHHAVAADDLRQITLEDMCSFIVYCQAELGSCAGTRSRKIVSIRQFWKYLFKSHIIDSNPAEDLETPKLPKRIPHFLSLEESVRLLIACTDAPRDHCILTLLLNCALRISELAAIDVNQVSTDILYVVGKGNKERRIYLTPAAKNSISRWLAVRTQPDKDILALFVSRNSCRMTVKALQDVVKKYVVRAGLDEKNVSAHTLRHTSATLMYKYGKADLRSLQQILGHESVATTEIYTHVDDSQLQSAVNSNPLAMMFNR